MKQREEVENGCCQWWWSPQNSLREYLMKSQCVYINEMIKWNWSMWEWEGVYLANELVEYVINPSGNWDLLRSMDFQGMGWNGISPPLRREQKQSLKQLWAMTDPGRWRWKCGKFTAAGLLSATSFPCIALHDCLLWDSGPFTDLCSSENLLFFCWECCMKLRDSSQIFEILISG